MTLLDILDPIDKSFGSVAAALFVVALGLLIWRVLWPALMLLTRSLYTADRRSYLRALRTLLGFLGLGLQAQSLYKAARLRIEAELIDPPPHAPLRLLSGSRHGHREALRRYRQERRSWNEKVRARLRGLLRRTDGVAVIEIDTCSTLIDSEGIQRYFDALLTQRPSSDEDPAFLSQVVVRSGFVAPLHLLSGVLARFDEEWQPLVEGYGRSWIQEGDPLRYSAARKTQASILECWLMWGPSVPLCTCPQWNGNVALQYGYGDENNSLSVRNLPAARVDELARQESEEIPPLAVQVRVAGTLRWGPRVPRRDLPPAQQTIWRDRRLVLDVEDPAGVRRSGGDGEQIASTYYSAYVWIVLVLCDSNGEPLHRTEKWRGLIPFFEHTNVADGDVYDFHTSQLAEKAVRGSLRLLDERPDLRLRFVAALDEAGCGFSLVCTRPGRTIREKMIEVVTTDPVIGPPHSTTHVDSTPAPADRLMLDFDPTAPWQGGDYSSCALPDIIEEFHGRDENAPTFRQLRWSSRADRELLGRFYVDHYVAEFPDPDERESLANIRDCLRKRDAGGYLKDDYHVLVALDEHGIPVGGSISDYLSKPNCGVIEFLFVDPARRGRGLGRRLLAETERLIRDSAVRAWGRQPEWIVAEMDDPFLQEPTRARFDPFTRAAIWHRWDYRLVDFPYVQPALSSAQEPVDSLLLMAKPLGDPRDAMPASRLTTIVHEYLRLAMRLPRPRENEQFRAMSEYLGSLPEVELLSLADYVGAGALGVQEVLGADDPNPAEIANIVDQARPVPSAAVPDGDLRGAWDRDGLASHPEVRPYLWGVQPPASSECMGSASFLTLPQGGFTQVVTHTGRLEHADLLRPLLRRIERRMVEDGSAPGSEPPSALRQWFAPARRSLRPIVRRMFRTSHARDETMARGWYIECSPAARDRMVRCGFVELDVPYRRPRPRSAQGDDARPHLLYKPFGRSYETPRLASREFLAAMRTIFDVVDAASGAERDACFAVLEAAVRGRDVVPLRRQSGRGGASGVAEKPATSTTATAT